MHGRSRRASHLLALVLVIGAVALAGCGGSTANREVDARGGEPSPAGDRGASVTAVAGLAPPPTESAPSASGVPGRSRPDPTTAPESDVPGPPERVVGGAINLSGGGPGREVADARGDVTGGKGAASDEADLVRVVVDAFDGTVRVQWEHAVVLPATRDDRQLNLVFLHDGDLDGESEHEVWATLTSSGWVSSYFFRGSSGVLERGSAQGITVVGEGSTTVATIPRSLLPDDDEFLWVAAAEDGTPSEYAAGTTWRDAVPDVPGVARYEVPASP